MKEEGFTLIEILIAITISGIILSAIFMVFDLSFSTWQRHDQTDSWEQEWRVIEKLLADDLNNLFISPLYQYNHFEGRGRRVEFTILEGRRPLKVSYSFDYANNQLIRELKLAENDKLLDQMTFFSAIDLDNLNFLFYNGDDGYWTEQWSYQFKEELPRSVKLSIVGESLAVPAIVNNIYLYCEY